MKALLRLAAIIIMISIICMSCQDPVSSDCTASDRTGAVCKDGTTTSSTGSGACSGHGGVERWICR